MIYTLTLSPCLDYILNVDNFTLGVVNRSNNENIYPGGKGINVSIVLKELNIPSTAIGFIGGFTGLKLIELLKEQQINTSFIKTNIDTRINIKISSKKETAINTNNNKIEDIYIKELINHIKSLLKDDDILVIGGNVPKEFKDDIYEQILNNIRGKKIKLIIDTNNKYLLQTLSFKPLLIKPNKEEVEEIFSIRINSATDAFIYAEKLQTLGARNVIISLDSGGAILLTENKEKIYIKDSSKQVINTVGCGDSMLAGMISGIVLNKDLTESFKIASACGIACANSIWLPKKGEIEKTYQTIKNVLKF